MDGIGGPATAPAPETLVIAGDWHGNQRWAQYVVTEVDALLPQQGTRLILHAGDFGIWPGREGYLRGLSRALADREMTLWFADGNHEDHDQLDRLHERDPGPVPVDDDGRIWHLPRGTRWTWHGRSWLAVGGAASPDRPIRKPSVSWWPQEALTAGQVAAVIACGPADVMLCHDCPQRYVPEQMSALPSWWDMEPCYASEALLQDIVDAVRPSQVFHGHFHTARDEQVAAAWGPVRVRGLAADGGPGNWLLISARL